MNEEFLISYLKKVNGIPNDLNMKSPESIRALMNITMPFSLSEEYYLRQDEYLQQRLKSKTIIDVKEFPNQISLYRGDITLLKADGIVNACNSKLLGCFSPLHGCIDNAIHSYAGLQVRRDCLKMMQEQGHDEANGQCKITSGYNLPSSFIFHTVGPIAYGRPTE